MGPIFCSSLIETKNRARIRNTPDKPIPVTIKPFVNTVIALLTSCHSSMETSVITMPPAMMEPNWPETLALMACMRMKL